MPPVQTLPAPATRSLTVLRPHATPAGVVPSLTAPVAGATASSSNGQYHAEEDALIIQVPVKHQSPPVLLEQ